MNRQWVSSRTLTAGLFLLVVITGLLLGWQRDHLNIAFSFADSIPFENIGKVVRSPGDDLYAVVFDAGKQIAYVTPEGSLSSLLRARNNPGRGFFFANEITFSPDRSLFVSSTYIDTELLAVNREAIIRFSPTGRHQALLFTIEHDPNEYVDNSGLIRGLQWTPEGLRFCIIGEEDVQSYLIDPLTGEVLDQVLTPVPELVGRITYASMSADGSMLALTTAATEIFTASPGGVWVKRYDGREMPVGFFSMPADIHILGEELFFSDLGQDAIMRLVGEGAAEPVFNEEIALSLGYEDDFFECKSFDIQPGHLVLPNNGKLVHFRMDPPQTIHVLAEARGGQTLWLWRVLLWVQMAVLVASGLAFLVLIIRNATPDGRRTARHVLLVGIMVITAVSMTAYMIFTNMNRRLEAEASRNLLGFLEMGRILVDAEKVERISDVRHFMNEDYQYILKRLQQTITRDGSMSPGTYSGVYRVIDNKVTALAYHDGLYSIFYPYDYNYQESIYAQVAETREPYIGEIVDIYGVWLIGVVPLINTAGDVVGFLEVGVDQSAQREANRELFVRALSDLAMVLFVLVFIFFEIGFFSSHVLDAAHREDDLGKQRFDEGALRFVSFIGITGVFLSASFLPLVSQSLAPVGGRWPLEMMIAFPFVIETLCGAMIALAFGHIRHKYGLKIDVLCGCLVVSGGMAATAMASTFGALLIARSIVGMGMGLLMISLRTYFLIEPDSARKEAGVIALTAGVVAGINTGSVSGGMLAARIGMQSVFWLQSILLLLAALATLLTLRNRHRKVMVQDGQRGSVFSFLRNRHVWGFFLFAFLPITACGLFLGFLFPLFAASQGASTNEISLAFMLFGVGSVYLGPALTRLTTFWFGARNAVAVGAFVMVGGLLFFAGMQSLAAAYIAITLFGLTDSFVFNQGITYYSSLPDVRRYGEDKAMGVYNVFESSGEALGPLAFGLAMGLGIGAGIATIASVLGACAFLFLAVTRQRKE